MPKQRRKPGQWRAIIADYEGSGLSREAFCQTRKLNLDRFGMRLRLAKKAKPSRAAFMLVRVRTEGIAVELGDVTVRCTTMLPDLCIIRESSGEGQMLWAYQRGSIQ